MQLWFAWYISLFCSVLFYFSFTRFLNLSKRFLVFFVLVRLAWRGTQKPKKNRREEWAWENERKICKNRFSDVGYTDTCFSIYLRIFSFSETQSWIESRALVMVVCAIVHLHSTCSAMDHIFWERQRLRNDFTETKTKQTKHWHFCDFQRIRLMNWRAVNVCGSTSLIVCVNTNRNEMQSIGKYVSKMQAFTLLSTCPPPIDRLQLHHHNAASTEQVQWILCSPLYDRWMLVNKNNNKK